MLNRNAVKGRQRFALNLCNINKAPHLQILIHHWEQKIVVRSEVGRERGGGHNHHFVFSQKGGVLQTLRRFNENRWRPLRAFPLKVLGNVFSSESDAGIADSNHRGNALKVTKVSNF
jgi:hypothetical protein